MHRPFFLAIDLEHHPMNKNNTWISYILHWMVNGSTAWCWSNRDKRKNTLQLRSCQHNLFKLAGKTYVNSTTTVSFKIKFWKYSVFQTNKKQNIGSYVMCWWPAHVFSMTCPSDRAEPKWNNFFKCYLSFVIDVYQNSEGYAGQSISQEKNHNVLPLFYGTEKKDVQKIFWTLHLLVGSYD